MTGKKKTSVLQATNYSTVLPRYYLKPVLNSRTRRKKEQNRTCLQLSLEARQAVNHWSKKFKSKPKSKFKLLTVKLLTSSYLGWLERMTELVSMKH